MDYKDWYILKVIGEEKNLTGAAKRLFLSQPALSFRLKNMEKEFDTPLMIRHPGGVFFTPQGEYLLRCAEEALANMEEVKKNIQVIENSAQGKIRLGISSVVAKFKLAPLLKRFQKQFPHIQVELATGSSTLELPKLLKENQIDIAILRGNPDWLSSHKFLLEEEPWCWVSANGENWKEIQETSWIQYQASSITGSLALQTKWWKEQYGEQLPPIIKVDSVEACLEMISYSFGWSIMPKAHLSQRRGLFNKPICWQGGEPLLWNTTMLCREGYEEGSAAPLFVRYVLQEYKKR